MIILRQLGEESRLTSCSKTLSLSVLSCPAISRKEVLAFWVRELNVGPGVLMVLIKFGALAM